LARPIITLTTDYGTSDHLVGTMKGVILGINPEAEIVDITHSIAPYDVLDAALTINQASRYFPNRTIHVVVVDPGVGTARRPLLVTAGTQFYIAPDNGVLSLVYEREKESITARHITADHYFLRPISNTFHGRDICAGRGSAIENMADRELWRSDRGFRATHIAEAESDRQCGQGHCASCGCLRKSCNQSDA
jgi:S-adenosylmethionine hydrolase